jgi:predicted Zn-dependent protease
MTDVDNLETMLAAGQDNALLRFALGNAFIRHGKYAQAVEHLARAIAYDAEYSAAWKLYARSLAETGRIEEAVSAYKQGIDIAERKGDKQAAKEMQVFLKRLLNRPT